MDLIHALVVLKYTPIAQVDWVMLSGELFVMTTGIFRMLGWSVINWGIQMLWLFHCLLVMVKELDQFGLIMCRSVLETSQMYLCVHTVELVTTTVSMRKMLQLNAQVCPISLQQVFNKLRTMVYMHTHVGIVKNNHIIMISTMPVGMKYCKA